MRLAAGMILVSVIIVGSSSPSQACGGHRSRCRGHHHRSAAPVMMSTTAAPVAMPVTYASPQMAQTSAPTQAAPVVVAAPTSLVAEVVPSYEYTAASSEQPAYYYTYDNSGKLVVAQWMDWVFRGGRAAGAPVPPLPIIGALRNR